MTANNFYIRPPAKLRGDIQVEHEDYDPESLYALMATHEKIRMLLISSSSLELILEKADVSTVYLYGNMDTPIITEHPTDSSGEHCRPGFVSLLESHSIVPERPEIFREPFCVKLFFLGYFNSLRLKVAHTLRRWIGHLVFSRWS